MTGDWWFDDNDETVGEFIRLLVEELGREIS
jgi:hypothetical protein